MIALLGIAEGIETALAVAQRVGALICGYSYRAKKSARADPKIGFKTCCASRGVAYPIQVGEHERAPSPDVMLCLQIGERRHDWCVIRRRLVAAEVRIGRNRWQRLGDNRSDRDRADWFDERGGDQDVVDQLFAPLINSREVLALGHQRREIPEPPMVRIVAVGYSNVYWYRGGREAWEMNGLPETKMVATAW